MWIKNHRQGYLIVLFTSCVLVIVVFPGFVVFFFSLNSHKKAKVQIGFRTTKGIL